MQSAVLYALVLAAGVSAAPPASGPLATPWVDSKLTEFHVIFSFIITGVIWYLTITN